MEKIKHIIKRYLGILPWQQQHAKHRKSIETYIADNFIKKIQFGCGPNNLNGWLNTDIIKSFEEVTYLDITQQLPIKSCTIDIMTSEHLIEHISFLQAKSFLSECFRVLKSKGRLRITTPDLAILLGLYSKSSESNKMYVKHMVENFIPTTTYNKEVFVINNAFRNWGHQFLYDKPTLINLLLEIGFIQVEEFTPGMSNCKDLQNIDARNKSYLSEINRFEVMVFEAIKP